MANVPCVAMEHKHCQLRLDTLVRGPDEECGELFAVGGWDAQVLIVCDAKVDGFGDFSSCTDGDITRVDDFTLDNDFPVSLNPQGLPSHRGNGDVGMCSILLFEVEHSAGHHSQTGARQHGQPEELRDVASHGSKAPGGLRGWLRISHWATVAGRLLFDAPVS